MTCGRFSPGNPVSSTNKTDRHDITEILLKVALNTIIQPTLLSISETDTGSSFLIEINDLLLHKQTYCRTNCLNRTVFNGASVVVLSTKHLNRPCIQWACVALIGNLL